MLKMSKPDIHSVMVRYGARGLKLVVLVLVALALSLLNFAHRPVVAKAIGAEAQLATYVALGGSLSDLCLAGGDGDDGESRSDCPACTVANGFALGPKSIHPTPIVVWSAPCERHSDTPVLSGSIPPAPPARGPPNPMMI